MTDLPFHTLDVFTETPYTGNPLAVVLDAGGLTKRQMQTIAREFNLSETIFVRPPVDPDHTAEVRIFLPETEIPFAGHPTIGCAILLAEQAQVPGDWTTLVTLEEQAGLVSVAVTRKGGRTHAELTAPVVPHAHPGVITAADAAAALGLAEGEIGFGLHRPAVWQGGPAFAYVPVTDTAALGRARPRFPAWDSLMAEAGVEMLYAYAPRIGVDYQARMFSPASGVSEDPATGSATAILAAQLWSAKAILPGTTVINLLQGQEMGRPSQLRLTIVAGDNGLQEVRVSGAAVRISAGRLAAPE
jgi:trans-2,3-dihydro-3-hydroxyanthranilate isomerase